MRKKEKTITLFVIFIFTLLFSNGLVFAEELGKKLEIVYPQIPGATAPEVISDGLPKYIEYIFHFSFYVIALIILGVLVYSGMQYFTSFGNPQKLTSAKQGIIAALSGTLILLSSYLVFNTINPQLTILVAPDPDLIEPSIEPGIYLCNYKPSVGGLISIYMQDSKSEEDKEKKIEAVTKLKEIMNVGKTKKACFRVNASTNIEFGSFNPASHTSFVVPKKKIVFSTTTGHEPGELETTWEWNYGMLAHDKDNRRGVSQMVFLYEEQKEAPGSFDEFGSANSVTLFQKNDATDCTVTLYQCLNYNEGGPEGNLCPAGVTGQPEYMSFIATGYNALDVPSAQLQSRHLAGSNSNDEDGARSITISPQGSGFALLYSSDGQTGNICNTFSENKGNLAQFDIGKCQATYNYSDTTNCSLAVDEGEQLNDCVPCLQSMKIIKGKLVK